MSKEYDNYLIEHRGNVERGYLWLKENLPELFDCLDRDIVNTIEMNCVYMHDLSKRDKDEYCAYDDYFYCKDNISDLEKNIIQQDFNVAWLHHIHKNPHHWQYWILNNDDPELGEMILSIPYEYIIEMICDWWSFSWKTGNLSEIFNWYNNHKDYIKMNSESRKIVEDILNKIKNKLVTSDNIENM